MSPRVAVGPVLAALLTARVSAAAPPPEVERPSTIEEGGYAEDVRADEPLAHWRLNGDVPGAIPGDRDRARTLAPGQRLELGGADWGGQELAAELWIKDASGTLLSYGRDGGAPSVSVKLGRALEVSLLGEAHAAEVSLTPGAWHLLGFSWRAEDGLLLISAGGRVVARAHAAKGGSVPFDGRLRIGELAGAVDEVAIFDRFVHPSRWLARTLVARGLRPASIAAARRPVEPTVQVGHAGFVKSIAWSPDGALVASGGGDTAVKLWDPHRGVLLRTMRHTDEVFTVSFSPDGERLASGSQDGLAIIWDPTTGARIHTLAAHAKGVTQVEISPDGALLATSGRGEGIKLWDVATGALVREIAQASWGAWSPDGSRFAVRGNDKVLRVYGDGGATLLREMTHPAWITAVAWSPDGTRIAAVEAKAGVRVWRVADGAALHYLDTGGEGPSPVAWSPDGERIATRAKGAGGVIVWSASSGAPLLRLHGPETMWRMGWNAEGTRLAVAAHERVYLFGSDGALVATLPGHGSSVFGLEWSPDGARLASGSFPQLMIWTPDGARVHELVTRARPIKSIGWSGDGRRLAVVTRNAVEMFDLDSGGFGAVLAQPGAIGVVELSPDRTQVATTGDDGKIRVWSLSSAAVVATVDCEPCSRVPVFLRFSPDGTRIAASPESEATAFVFDARTGARVATLERSGPASRASWSRDGRRLATRSKGEGVRVWDTRTGKAIRVLPFQWAWRVEWSPDDRVIAAWAEDQTLELWSADTGARLHTLKRAPQRFDAVKWGPQGGWLATHTSYSDVVEVFDVATGTRTAALRHAPSIWTFAPSPDGTRVATGALDGTVRLWSLGGELLRTLSMGAYLVRDLDWSPDGRFLAARSEEGTAKIWDLSRGTGVTLIGAKTTGWVAITDDGRFEGSAGDVGPAVAMVQGTRAYEIAQLAPARNRPDQVVAALGGPAAQLGFYEALWLRRLARMGLKREQITEDFSAAPVARISGVDRGSAPGVVDLRVGLEDAAGLESFQVFVNGTPAGPRTAVGGRRHRTVVPVQLTRGTNQVEVTALNAQGIESLRASARIEQGGEGLPAPRLFFLGFGVSNYQDDRLDLGFAHQDVLDLASTLKRARGFASTRVETFTDREVSPAALDRARAVIAEVTEHDTLIMFIAGHGARDEDAQHTYYYLDHDARFDDLARTAIPFDAIEDLLYGARARRKLFLMDTCQSGEDIDVGGLTASLSGVRGLQARSIRGVKLAGSQAMSADLRRLWLGALRDRDRLILMDLTRRSGAIVLASSLGQESSLESPTWRNGAFTEEILRALLTKVADTNHDGAVDTAELEAHVLRAVPALTGDRQHPGVERDNPLQRFALTIGR